MIKINRYTYYFLFTSLVVFLFGSLTKLDIPLGEWDRVSLYAAESWAKGINKEWIFDHPPLYPFFLTVLFKLFGPGPVTARLGNIFSVLFTAMILFRLTSQLFNRDTAAWAVFFYLSSPVCIQGTSSMNVADTSLLPLAFIATANAIKNNTLNPGLKNTCVLALWTGICFWAKVSSSIALITGLILGILGCVLLEKHRKEYRSWMLNITGIFSGTLFFLISWLLVSCSLWSSRSSLAVLKAPLRAIASNHNQHDFVVSLLHTGYDSMRVFTWFSPYVIMVLAIVIMKALSGVKKGFSPDLKVSFLSNKNNIKFLFVWLTFFYFVGHLAVGGTSWGFPRYHVAILPLLCMFVGYYVSKLMSGLDKKILGITSITILFLIVLYVLSSKDPLLFLNLKLKEMLLYNYGKQDMVREAFITFVPLYGLPVICVLVLLRLLKTGIRGKAFAICLFVGSLSTVIYLDVQQILAPYRTTNQYGAVGKKEMVRKVRGYIKDGDCVYSTPEVIYALRDKGVPYVAWQEWKNEEVFHNFLQSKNPKVIVAGLTLNTLDQLRWLLGEDMKKFLSKNYKFSIIGTYFLWFRIADG
jgi:hypothetical protein